MIILQAPYPNVETVTILPSPAGSDTEFPISILKIRRAMNGDTGTRVRGGKARRLTYEFRLSRKKALEMQEFLESYYGSKIRMINHKDEVWLINFTSNPFQFSNLYKDTVTIQLQMEGQKL